MLNLPSAFIFLIVLLVLFMVVALTVNYWVRYKTWHDDDLVVQQIYTGKRLVILYARCWVIVVAVFSLLYWVEMDILLVLLVLLLAALAIEGIIQGENLAEIRLLQSQSENMMLRSQLNPHFLYNTLNNIDALIWLDQDKASRAVTDLSGLMRYITYSAKQDSVSVGEEVENLNLLVELQRLRMSSPDSLIFQTEIDNPRKSIAPLLLLPLFENCFKHCGNLSEKRAIELTIVVKDDILDFRSSNNVSTAPPAQLCDEAVSSQYPRRKGGLGLRILQRRLSLLYGNRFLLETENVDNRYNTHLQIRLMV